MTNGQLKSDKYRPKNFREVLSEYETKVTSLKESPDNEYIDHSFSSSVLRGSICLGIGDLSDTSQNIVTCDCAL